MLAMLSCPLCAALNSKLYCQGKIRRYFQCEICSLVFVPPEYYLSAENERAEYDLHCNSPEDQGYRAFLQRLFSPICERIPAGSKGLDFGSGPGPTLSVMFEEAGFSMEVYDYFYAYFPELLQKKYDFITASEVVEHLHNPGKELSRLWGLLEPDGYLGIMTKQVINQKAFGNWHYIQDPTHVCFFSQATFRWLADFWQGELTMVGNDVVLFHKK